MRRLGVAALCALLLVTAAGAAPKTILTQKRATAIFLANPKVANWLRHYPPKTRTTEATYSAQFENWTIKVWTSIDKVGEVATGRVQDSTGVVTEAWTGPQVAWKMARGYQGAFGGKEINSLPIWLGFCAAFLIGLADFRRPLSLRNLDLLALVSFSVSLWYFNKGHVFTAMPLVYPPLVYLLGRMIWSVWRGHTVAATRPVWPVWLLAAAAVLVILPGIGLIGLRLGGLGRGERIAIAGAVRPFTQYVSFWNTNNAIPRLFRIWGFWRVTSSFARGVFSALAGWTKFAPLLVAPLWASYPDALARPREKLVFLGGFLAATVVAFSVLLLEPSPLHAVQVFYDRTIEFQIGRHSPVSIWDWKQYGAGYPDLHLVQRALQVLLVIGAIAVYFLPRRKTARQLAALTAALPLGFELVLTHWFYLYLPWFFPFVAFVALTAERETAAAEAPAPREHDGRALVAAG